MNKVFPMLAVLVAGALLGGCAKDPEPMAGGTKTETTAAPEVKHELTLTGSTYEGEKDGKPVKLVLTPDGKFEMVLPETGKDSTILLAGTYYRADSRYALRVETNNGTAQELEMVATKRGDGTMQAPSQLGNVELKNTAKGDEVAPIDLSADPKPGDEVAVFETGKGKIVIMFYPQIAPKSVANFKELISSGFYNGTRFHRCIENFMVQGGDPKSKDVKLASEWGTGGNMKDGVEVNVPHEFGHILLHKRGVVSMARSNDVDSASSQFFLMQHDYPSLDGQYSAFGRIVKGLDVVDQIVKTGSKDPNANGSVKPDDAVLLNKATLAKWPVN
ncbi:MAG: peptidylprolyl isomerase [Armatimonadetes bacterium]|nr:peptidylprolyl isomerase [Armatimonadota bacterium]MBX3107769.1 peptidylprolyl isomerase [Fimbriimonadaceae bacterium]